MTRRTLLLLFLLLTTLLPASAAWACSCAMQTAPEFLTDTGGPVFVGTLADREPAELGVDDPEQMVRWTFEVDRVLVGELPSELTIIASGHGAMCGLAFEPGARVGLKLFPEGDAWTSNGCLVHDPDELLALEPGEAPLDVEPSTEDPDGAGAEADGGTEAPWLALAVTVAAAAASLGGIVVLSRRRRTGS